MLDRLRACIIASYYGRAGKPVAQVSKHVRALLLTTRRNRLEVGLRKSLPKQQTLKQISHGWDTHTILTPVNQCSVAESQRGTIFSVNMNWDRTFLQVRTHSDEVQPSIHPAVRPHLGKAPVGVAHPGAAPFSAAREPEPHPAAPPEPAAEPSTSRRSAALSAAQRNRSATVSWAPNKRHHL